MIDDLVKKAALHPVDQMRAGQQYNLGLQNLQAELGVGDPGTGLAENEDYYRRVRELYDRFLAPQPAEEKAPKVISVPK